MGLAIPRQCLLSCSALPKALGCLHPEPRLRAEQWHSDKSPHAGSMPTMCSSTGQELCPLCILAGRRGHVHPRELGELPSPLTPPWSTVAGASRCLTAQGNGWGTASSASTELLMLWHCMLQACVWGHLPWGVGPAPGQQLCLH